VKLGEWFYDVKATSELGVLNRGIRRHRARETDFAAEVGRLLRFVGGEGRHHHLGLSLKISSNTFPQVRVGALGPAAIR